MLDHLLQRLIDTLASDHSVTLATCGAADIQAGVFPCAARDAVLYLLTPGTSDHLLNIEGNPSVVVIGSGWRLQGHAVILAGCPAGSTLENQPDVQWSKCIAVHPVRLHIEGSAAVRGYAETIDVI